MAADHPKPDAPLDLGGLMTPSPEETDRLVGGARPALRQLAEGETYAGRFVIEALIGEGGAGSVYRAMDRLTGRPIALKLIRTDRLAMAGARERLIAETVTARDIRHPNVVAVYDAGEVDGQPYMTMELLTGQSLRGWMRGRLERDADCSFETAAHIVGGVLAGLDAAHSQGVVHRDLKPENIFLTADPDDDAAPLKILDFGIARAAGTRTDSAGATGTPHYMAPEQITAPDTVKPSADLYSVSVIFYELLVGVLPQGHWQPPGEGRTDIPAGIDELIRRGLSNDRRKRPQSAAEYRDAIDAALDAAAPETEDGDEQADVVDETEKEESAAERIGKDALKRALALFGAADAEATDAEKAEARRLFGEAARWGVPLAMSNYAWMLERGVGGPEDKVAARDWYRAAAEAGLVMGMTNYAGLLVNGVGGPKDLVVARQWYEKAAARDDADAKAWLTANPVPAPAATTGDVSDKPDPVEALGKARLLEARARDLARSNPQASREAWNEAHTFYKIAAHAGAPEAKLAYGRFLDQGNGGLWKSEPEIARQWYESAAEDGSGEACYWLGDQARRGRGVEKIRDNAVGWFKLAGERGYIEGYYAAGFVLRMKMEGEPVPVRARKFFQLAAENGHTSAMLHLAEMLAAGEGGPKDRAEARRWLIIADKAGHSSSKDRMKELGL